VCVADTHCVCVCVVDTYCTHMRWTSRYTCTHMHARVVYVCHGVRVCVCVCVCVCIVDTRCTHTHMRGTWRHTFYTCEIHIVHTCMGGVYTWKTRLEMCESVWVMFEYAWCMTQFANVCEEERNTFYTQSHFTHILRQSMQKSCMKRHKLLETRVFSTVMLQFANVCEVERYTCDFPPIGRIYILCKGCRNCTWIATNSSKLVFLSTVTALKSQGCRLYWLYWYR